jgi:ParB-like chromosome segregation protein Spo0J
VEPIKTQVFKLADIKPAPYNPRVELTEKDREFKALTASIEQHGLVQPLIVNIRDGYLIGGHQRLNVLKAAGETETEAVVVDLDEAHAKALCLALNKLDGEWDYGILYDIMNELRDAGADTLSTGFTDREIDDLIGEIGQEIDDEESADIDTSRQKQSESDEIKCYVGIYNFKMSQDEFDDLIADVREKVDFTRQLVEEEIKRRLFRA